MANSWKLSAHAPKRVVQAALLAHDELEEWDFDLVIAGREISEDRPQDWVLEAWYPKAPGKEQKDALASLFEGKAPKIAIEKLPDEDWLTLSQQGTQPIDAGPFHVHTPDFEPVVGAINFAIPASQAFGTGQHQTADLVVVAQLFEDLAHAALHGGVQRVELVRAVDGDDGDAAFAAPDDFRGLVGGHGVPRTAVENVSGEYWKCQSVSGRFDASSRITLAPARAISITSGLLMRNTMSRHAGLTAL